MEDFWKRAARDKDRIRFKQAVSFSPYSEFSKNWIMEEGNVCQLTMNGLYRYDAVLEPLFSNSHLSSEQKEWLFDVMMHYLTELEYRKGVTLQEAYIREHMRDLAKGIYGKTVQEAYRIMTLDQQFYIASTLEKQKRNRESVYLFCDCLIKVMYDGVIYKDKENDKVLMFYINAQRTDMDEQRIQCIKELFMPLGYELKTFWQNHFAVIGYSQTMQLGDIELI